MVAKAGDLAGAEVDLDAAAAAAPPTSDVRLTLGHAYSTAGLHSKAVTQFDQWIAHHGRDAKLPSAYNGRCWARALMGRELDQALADCNAALRWSPQTPGYMDSRGLVYVRRGELDRALAEYDAALKLAPKMAWSLYGRGLAK